MIKKYRKPKIGILKPQVNSDLPYPLDKGEACEISEQRILLRDVL